MSWRNYGTFPVTFPTGPIGSSSEDFDALFIRVSVYDELDKYLTNIESQHGKFWITSEGGGYGKSTMLHYIDRWLIQNIEEKRTIPLLIRVSGEKRDVSIRIAFIQEILREFLQIGETLSSFQGMTSQNSITREIFSEFSQYKRKVEHLRDRIPVLSEAEIESKFRKLLDEVLRGWKKRGILKRMVLLIDEVDKLDMGEVTEFLGKNQGLFEDLCDRSGIIVFFTGHKAWVDQISSGTEYSYYHGHIFRVPHFFDLQDIRSLIEARQFEYAHVRTADSPWDKSGLEKLRDITGGVPRRLILLASSTLNYAYKKTINTIGPSVVVSAVTDGESGKLLKTHLEKNPSLYSKLKRSSQLKVDMLLPIFYNRPNQQIPMCLDDDLDQRTTTLGVEYDDSKWRDSIEVLLRLECIEKKSIGRQLSSDVIGFFDMMTKSNIEPLYLSDFLKKIKVKPRTSGEVQKPDFQEAIERAFRVTSHKWLTEEQVFMYFSDKGDVQVYVQSSNTQNWTKNLEKIFRKEWAKYQEKSKVVCFSVNAVKLFSILPDSIARLDYDAIASLDSKRIIDLYLDLEVKEFRSVDEFKEEANALLTETVRKLCRYRLLDWDSSMLHEAKQRVKLLQKLKLGDNVIGRIEQFYVELAAEDTDERLLALLSTRTAKLLAQTYRAWRKEESRREEGFDLESRVRELVNVFDGRKVRIGRNENASEYMLHKYDVVEPRTLRCNGEIFEFDVYASRRYRQAKHILVAECKLRNQSSATKDDIIKFMKKTKILKEREKMASSYIDTKQPKIESMFFFTSGQFEDDTLALCRKHHIIAVSGEELNKLLKQFGLRRMKLAP